MRLRLKKKQVDLRLRIVTVPGAQEEAQRNGVGTEKKKDKSSSCDVSVTCDDLPCFSWIVLEINWCCAICFSRDLICQRIRYLTLSSLLFFTNSVVVITEYSTTNYFQSQCIGRVKKTLKSNTPQTRFFCVGKSAAGKIFCEKLRRKQKMRHRKDFFWLNPGGYFVLFMYYVNHNSQMIGQNLFPLINELMN